MFNLYTRHREISVNESAANILVDDNEHDTVAWRFAKRTQLAIRLCGQEKQNCTVELET